MKPVVVMNPPVIDLGNNRSICQGSSTTLDAGPNFSSYLWSTGATTQTITVASAGTYTVNATRWGCNASDNITITTAASPTVSLGTDQTVCTGQSTTFDAGFCNGCTYQWGNITTGQPNIGTGQTYTTGTAGKYMVTVTNATGCIGRDTVQLFVSNSLPVNLTIAASANPVCSGTLVVFTITVANNPGPSPAYQWFVNGTAVGSNSPTYQYTPVSGDLVKCRLTSSLSCTTGNPAMSNQITMTVNSNLAVTTTITASGNPACSGTPVTFTASSANQGSTPIYQWYVNGGAVFSGSPVYTYTPASGDLVFCQLTSSESCTTGNPATSNTVSMVVNPNLPVNISISASINPVCAGLPVNFTANAGNPGTLPVYQWKVNGAPAGTGNQVYTYVPAQGDQVSCILTSSELCTAGNPANSNTVTMTVNPLLPVNITIAPSANPVCAGQPVTFTSNVQFPGASPGYQWFVNSITAGMNNPAFTLTPVNGDTVSCILTSGELCTVNNPATANTVVMTVNPLLPVSLTITPSANPVCAGLPVSFSATGMNAGAAPLFSWFINGTAVGQNTPTYSYIPSQGDQVWCSLSSSATCATGNPASSNRIRMTLLAPPVVSFTPCFDTITTLDARPFKLKGGIPLGGTYSGPGVDSFTATFTPSTAGTGLKTITYTSTNASACIAAGSAIIDIRTTPAITCGNQYKDPRDGTTYPTNLIGSQCWLAANLNYGRILSSQKAQSDNCIAEKYCYNDDNTNCTGNGGLYQWDEMMRFEEIPAMQGLCPPGWHIPTESEWNTLFNSYTSNAFAAYPLLHKDFSGFVALTSGVVYLNKNWDFKDFATFFWTSNMDGSEKAYAHGLNWHDTSVSLYSSSRSNAFSVRCLRD